MAGHKHNFKHIGGGCMTTKVEDEMRRCDDEYECECGEKIILECSSDIHSLRPEIIVK